MTDDAHRAGTAPDFTLPHVEALRYMQPLREGGSLPAVVDTAGGMYVVKFRGAGQGPRALLAELICGMLARVVGLPVPELALVHVCELFGRSEPDPEIQDLLRASHGVNVGVRYLDGAFNFDGFAAGDVVDARFASDLVWFDAFVTNPDRTHRNTNLLVWQRKPWLIDHGAALYAHHDWPSVDEARARTPFPLIRDHVLLLRAEHIREADEWLAPLITADVLHALLAALPDELLAGDSGVSSNAGDAPDAVRQRYHEYLSNRLLAPRAWVDEAVRARDVVQASPPQRQGARR